MYRYVLILILALIHLSCASQNSRQIHTPESVKRSEIINQYRTQYENTDVKKICEFGNRDSSKLNSDLGKFLEESQTQFSTQKAREDDPQAYIDSLNKIVSMGGYSFLLDCRDQWTSKKNQTFKIIPFDISKTGQIMSLGLNETQQKGETFRELNLRLDLKTSFQKVLFTYMHEILHVCHEMDRDRLSSEQGVHDRFSYLIEIEAMGLMMKSFEDLSSYSPRLCREEDSVLKQSEKNLYQVYSEGKKEFFKGSFPQRVITWYLSYLKDSKKAIFQKHSRSHTYPKSGIGEEFKMKCLNSDFASQIKSMGFPLIQPQCGI